MTIQPVEGAMWIPWLPSFVDDTAVLQDFISMDAPHEKVSSIIQITQDGTLDQFEWCATQGSSLPSGSVVRYSFQGVSNGQPDGVIGQYRTDTPTFSSLWVETGILSDDGTDNGNKRVVTRGELVACVIDWDIQNGPADLIAYTYCTARPTSSNRVLSSSSGTWSEISSAIPMLALKYDDGSYPYLPGVVPSFAIAENEISALPQWEWGIAVSLPAPVLLGGVVVFYELIPVNTGTISSITLYDKDFYTILEQVDASGALGMAERYHSFVFSQNHLLDANEVYRIVVSHNYTTGDTGILLSFLLDHEGLLDIFGGGERFYLTSRQGGDVSLETWEDNHLQKPAISLMITGVDHSTFGGGTSNASIES